MNDKRFKGLFFRARVVRGAGRGKGMGFPTANLDAADVDLGHGVYLVQAEVLGRKYKGLLFFGSKETFGEPVSLEVFIQDLASDIYGETVAVRLMKKIRDIKKFDNPRELQKQIERDVAENLS
ncbi:MAG: riboflavin kinase [Minisyncoccales bacterium]